MSRINNYLRNRRGEFFFFDDRDPEAVREANSRVGMMSHGEKDRVVAWKPAPKLFTDGYVGVCPIRDIPATPPPSLLS